MYNALWRRYILRHVANPRPAVVIIWAASRILTEINQFRIRIRGSCNYDCWGLRSRSFAVKSTYATSFCGFWVDFSEFDFSPFLFPFLLFFPVFRQNSRRFIHTISIFSEQKPNRREENNTRTKTEQFPFISSRLCLKDEDRYR